jgi:hypothetical protein
MALSCPGSSRAYETGVWARMPSATVTSGYPPWRIPESLIARTGSPLTSSRAFHKSPVTVLE